MNVSDTAAWWSKVWKLAPSFDLIAIQDHLGQGYGSRTSASTSQRSPRRPSPLAAAACGRTSSSSDNRPDRTVPAPTYCHNCVAKWPRVKAQLALESSLPHVTKRIAWEWTGCLSPNYGPEGPNTSKALYAEYKAYIDAGVAAA